MIKTRILAFALVCFLCMPLGACGDGTLSEDNSEKGDSSSQIQVTTYTVTFKQEGQEDVVYTVKAGEDLKESPLPKSKTGYNVEWETVDLTNITEDIIVTARETAKQYIVIYDSRGGNISQTTFTVKYGEYYTLQVPSYSGYSFDGWSYKDEILPLSGYWNIDEQEIELEANWSAWSGLI